MHKALFNLDSRLNSPNEIDTTSIFKVWWYDTPAWSLVPFVKAAFSSLHGMNVLELGPLEGHQTHFLYNEGCNVTAIEGKPYNYLKCLVNKELTGHGGKFLLGNFIEYLRQHDIIWDMIFSNGVLYHVANPIELIELMCTRSRRLYLGSCYWESAEAWEKCGGLFPDGTRMTFQMDDINIVTWKHTYKMREYRHVQQLDESVGNIEQDYGYLMRHEDIKRAVEYYGHEIIAEELLTSNERPQGPVYNICSRKVQ